MGKILYFRLSTFVLCAIVALSNLAVPTSAQVNVTTWHNDNLRTGQNINETILTPSNLSTSNFGQLCSLDLDGQVYAQPLIMTNVTIQGTTYPSVAYVVTQNNTLYAINGTPQAGSTTCTQIASLSLTPPGQYPTDCHYVGGGGCGTVSPVVGILATPAIRTVSTNLGSTGTIVRTLYAVTETQDTPIGQPPSQWFHYLHAVDLNQLVEVTAPVRIFPPGFSNGQASTWSFKHLQRPGLLYAGNYVYIAFSMMDGNAPLPNGSVFRYSAANLAAQPLYFPTTPGSAQVGGGVWAGGAGLAYGPDESGKNYLYFTTGNGLWDGNTSWGDSFVKLDPSTLTVPSGGYFTPADQSYRNCLDPYSDQDFGSSGVMLTPSTSYWPYLALTGDKEGGFWAIDRLNPGQFTQGQCTSDCNACSSQNQDASNQNLQTIWFANKRIHNTPAYWNNYVYVAPANSTLAQYALCNNFGSGKPFCNSASSREPGPANSSPTGYGLTPSISASSDSENGILWAIRGDGNPLSTNPGQLYAYDATTLATLYLSSGTGSPCPQVDAINPAAKFSVPTVANGYVYLGTMSANTTQDNTGLGTFYIFGLNRQCELEQKIVKGGLHAVEHTAN